MKKSKYRKLKVLSLILSVIMIICSVPINAIAETVEPETDVEDSEYVYDVMESEEIELESDESLSVISEVESLRDENVKHFKMPDGTYEMIVYGEAVHRKDADGKWQDIDNNLSLTDIKTESLYASSDMRTVFAQSYQANKPLMTLSENGYSISMSLVSDTIDSGLELMSISEPAMPAVQNATLRKSGAAFDTIDQAAEVDNRSSIKYSNVRANTDIEYVMNGNDVKENIIVKAKGSNYIYRFDLSLTGLSAELVNNTVIIKDSVTGDTEYVIPEPYMYDADGNISYDVSYTLTDKGLGTYRLTITADSSWINAEGRAFPVVVDPTMHPIVLEDTYVSSSSPSTNYRTSGYLKVSSGQTAFLRAGLPFPDDVLVNSASLNISYYYSDNVTAGSTTVGAYRVQSEWDEATLTYNTLDDVNIGSKLSQLTLSGSIGATATSPSRVSFDITDMVDLWTLNSPNYGIALKYISHVSNSTVTFVSSNSSLNRPSIHVNYTYKIGNGGVFAIENVGTENQWLTVEDEEDARLTSKYCDTSPLSTAEWDLSRLFKISKHSNNSSYIIRSMIDNCLSIQPQLSENGVMHWKIVEIDPDDTNIPVTQTFNFSFDATLGGYRITPYGDLGNLINYVSTDAFIRGDGAANAGSSWNLTKYVGEDINYYNFSLENEWDTNGVIIGTEYTGTVLGYSTKINVNKFDWSISNTHGAITFTQDETSGEITFVPLLFAQFGISFNFYYGASTTPQSKVTKGYVTNRAEGFFIQNVATSMYMDVDDSPDESIIQNKYSASNSQRWIFECVDEPSYLAGGIAIKSASSGEYLGVDVDDTARLRLYDYIDDFSVWNVDRTSDGTYTFTCNPTIPDGYIVSVPSQSSGEGADIIQQQESDMDSDECDEWYIVNKVISMVNYYDNSFANYVNLINHIDDAVSFANNVYARYFGIGIYMDENAISYEQAHANEENEWDKKALADQCNNYTINENGDILYEECDDSCHNMCVDENIFFPNNDIALSECGHHKNLSLVSAQLKYQYRENEHIYVLWANRPRYTYCLYEKDPITKVQQHTTKSWLASTIRGTETYTTPFILFLSIVEDNTIIGPHISLSFMSISLVHEIAHALGMIEMYEIDGHDENFEFICTMEYFERGYGCDYYDNVLSNFADPFCEDCMAQMKKLTSEYIRGQKPILGYSPDGDTI